MGCKPSPIRAIVRVYTFERRSIYTDIAYISAPYGKYIDDAYTIAFRVEDAIKMFQSISDQDPDNLLKWEVDFPKSTSDFAPFLGTAIRIEEDGEISYKFYRKSQKKNITLHFKSHHTMKTKVDVMKNFYTTAEKSSSSPELVEESKLIIDNLLWYNGDTDSSLSDNVHALQPNILWREFEISK